MRLLDSTRTDYHDYLQSVYFNPDGYWNLYLEATDAFRDLSEPDRSLREIILRSYADQTNAGMVIQLAPSIRTADDNIKGLEAGTLAYPGVTAAKYADQFTSFTFKDTTYHISYMAAGDYHITDESAGRVHYFFKIGNDELEDRKPSMPSKSKPQNDKKLSDLPADVFEFVQTLFKQDLMSPEDEETIEGMVQDFLKGKVYDNPKEARTAALEAFAGRREQRRNSGDQRPDRDRFGG